MRGAVRSLVLCATAWLVGVALSGTVVHSQGVGGQGVAGQGRGGQGAGGQGRGGQGAAQRRSLEGTLEVLYEDAIDSARIRHFLNTGTERVPLRFERNPPRHLLHGSRVRMNGTVQSDGTLMLTAGDAANMTTVSLSTPYTFGPQATLVILFTFSDNPTQPFAPATAQAITFTDANNFDLENSFGQTSLAGTVTSWLSIASGSTTCSYNSWAMLADQAATNAGFPLASYPRRVYAFPHVSACTWVGLGTIGGGGSSSNPSRAWINGSFTLQAVAHEMGHNFGLYHSHSNTCDSGGCVVTDYGDDHDVMGNYAVAHFNAHQKEWLGWLNYATSPPIQLVTSPGPVSLEPYETPAGALPKALEVLKSSSGGANTYLYAELRTQYGFDGTVTPGVLIHTGVDNDGDQSNLQDLQPTTATTDFILDPGQSVTFTGDSGPITLTTLSAGSTGAVVAYTQSSSPCTYSLGSSSQSIGSAGGSGSVTLTTASSCYWNASSDVSWISVDAGNDGGQGPGTVHFTVAANSGLPRSGTVTITGQTYKSHSRSRQPLAARGRRRAVPRG